MPDTPRTQAALLALFADNSSGAISAQAARDLIVSALIGTDYVGLGPAVVRTIASGTIDVTGLRYVIVNGEGGADDVLTNMTGFVDGQVVYLEQGDATITLGANADPPGQFAKANQERLLEFELGNYTSFMKATYSATAGKWWMEADYVSDTIMASNGSVEIIAHDTNGLNFHVASGVKPMQITQTAGVPKIGVFSKADESLTAVQQTVANIGSPATATAEDCANKINALLTALRAYGWLT